MHIPGSVRRIAFLSKAPRLGAAPILVSFWVREGTSPDEGRAFRLAKWFRFLRGRRAEPLEPGDHVTERGYHRCFAKAEIEAEFKAGRFRMCRYSRRTTRMQWVSRSRTTPVATTGIGTA